MCEEKAGGIPRTLNQHTQTCSICEAVYEIDSFDPNAPLVKLMGERNICFQCAFWSDKIEKPLLGREIINGEHFVFHPCQDKPLVFQGFGGREFYALLNDNSLIMSNNVWHQGKIPERFCEKLPDTARFISKKTYKKLINDSFKCRAKGCWDRYHCIRYDISIEESTGAWNVIPGTHIPGEENCESFINKNQL
jgi:uncharacterized protein YlaI